MDLYSQTRSIRTPFWFCIAWWWPFHGCPIIVGYVLLYWQLTLTAACWLELYHCAIVALCTMVLDPGQYISQCANEDEDTPHQSGKGGKKKNRKAIRTASSKYNVDSKWCIDRATEIANHVLQVLKLDSVRAASVLDDQLYDEVGDEVEFGDGLVQFQAHWPTTFWWQAYAWESLDHRCCRQIWWHLSSSLTSPPNLCVAFHVQRFNTCVIYPFYWLLYSWVLRLVHWSWPRCRLMHLALGLKWCTNRKCYEASLSVSLGQH